MQKIQQCNSNQMTHNNKADRRNRYKYGILVIKLTFQEIDNSNSGPILYDKHLEKDKPLRNTIHPSHSAVEPSDL